MTHTDRDVTALLNSREDLSVFQDILQYAAEQHASYIQFNLNDAASQITPRIETPTAFLPSGGWVLPKAQVVDMLKVVFDSPLFLVVPDRRTVTLGVQADLHIHGAPQTLHVHWQRIAGLAPECVMLALELVPKTDHTRQRAEHLATAQRMVERTATSWSMPA